MPLVVSTDRLASLSPQGLNGKKVRVFVTDDHELFRKGIIALLKSAPGLVVCGEAATPGEAMSRLPASRADVAIVDLLLEEGSGLDLIQDIRAQCPKVYVLALISHEAHLFAERALRAGARGYVRKQDSPARLMEGIRTIAHGGFFVEPAMTNMLMDVLIGSGARRDDRIGLTRLTDKELDIFERIGRGESTHEIAFRLHLSAKTVETYRTRIKRKLCMGRSESLVHAATAFIQGRLGSKAKA